MHGKTGDFVPIMMVCLILDSLNQYITGLFLGCPLGTEVLPSMPVIIDGKHRILSTGNNSAWEGSSLGAVNGVFD